MTKQKLSPFDKIVKLMFEECKDLDEQSRDAFLDDLTDTLGIMFEEYDAKKSDDSN